MGSLTGRVRRQAAHERYPVQDPSDVGALRRAVGGHLRHMRPDPGLLGRAELVVTELGTNLLRHPQPPGGWVLVRPLYPHGLEVLAVDRGADPRGFPGARRGPAAGPGGGPGAGVGGGLGVGLAAVRRAAARFDIHHRPGEGTAVLAVLDEGPATSEGRPWAGVSVSITGAECGDGWAAADLGDGAAAVAVIDGLGHGVQASVAADAALATFAAAPGDVEGFLTRANEAMWGTRGGAVLVCRLEPRHGLLHYLSVGNVEGCVVPPEGVPRQSLCPDYGTVGAHQQPPRARIKTAGWTPGATLVIWTDGLTSRLGAAADAGLLRHDPAVVAAVLHRDHTRDRDDATVVVVRDPLAVPAPTPP